MRPVFFYFQNICSCSQTNLSKLGKRITSLCLCLLLGHNIFCPDEINFVPDEINFVPDKKILPTTKTFCLGQNILSTAKKFISSIHKSLKMTSFVQKLTVSSGREIFLDLYVAEMNSLAMDKIFCLRQMKLVPDKFDFN